MHRSRHLGHGPYVRFEEKALRSSTIRRFAYGLNDFRPFLDLWFPRSRRLSPNDRSSGQAARLRRTLEHARSSVPYYRRLFDRAGITPDDVRTASDLNKIPVTTKQDMRAAPAADLLSTRVGRGDLIVARTAGSTGVPMTFYQTRAENFLLHLTKLKTLRSLGLAWGDRMIKVQNREYVTRPSSWLSIQRLGVLRQEIVASTTAEAVAAELAGKNADVLTSYNGMLARLAQVLACRENLALKPRFLVGSADVLTPFMRSQIKATFKAHIWDTYLSREFGVIAWECPSSGQYHVAGDHLIVEVLKDGAPCRPGEEGEVIVTSLISRAMPFIRFKLDDIVTLSAAACPCGRRVMSFDKLLGKKQDYFWLPGGVEFNPWRLSALWMSRADWILQFELIQEALESIVLRIVPAWPPPAKDVEALLQESRMLLGPGIDFRLELAADIKPAPGEKFRVHRSLVRSFYDDPKAGKRA